MRSPRTATERARLEKSPLTPYGNLFNSPGRSRKNHPGKIKVGSSFQRGINLSRDIAQPVLLPCKVVDAASQHRDWKKAPARPSAEYTVSLHSANSLVVQVLINPHDLMI